MSFNDPADVEAALQVATPPVLEIVIDGPLNQTRPPTSAQTQQAPTPPTATIHVTPGQGASPDPRGNGSTAILPPTIINAPATPTCGPSGVAVPGPTTVQPTNAPAGLPSVKPASVQAVPQSPAATQMVTPLIPGTLISNTQTALQQNPTGTMMNISTLSQS